MQLASSSFIFLPGQNRKWDQFTAAFVQVLWRRVLWHSWVAHKQSLRDIFVPEFWLIHHWKGPGFNHTAAFAIERGNLNRSIWKKQNQLKHISLCDVDITRRESCVTKQTCSQLHTKLAMLFQGPLVNPSVPLSLLQLAAIYVCEAENYHWAIISPTNLDNAQSIFFFRKSFQQNPLWTEFCERKSAMLQGMKNSFFLNIHLHMYFHVAPFQDSANTIIILFFCFHIIYISFTDFWNCFCCGFLEAVAVCCLVWQRSPPTKVGHWVLAESGGFFRIHWDQLHILHSNWETRKKGKSQTLSSSVSCLKRSALKWKEISRANLTGRNLSAPSRR